MIFKNPYMTVNERVSTLQRWILVHSYIYYKTDKNYVLDSVFDANCKQLVKMMEDHPEAATRYSEAFEGFDGNTGFDLYDKCSRDIQKLIESDFGIVAYGSGKRTGEGL